MSSSSTSLAWVARASTSSPLLVRPAVDSAVIAHATVPYLVGSLCFHLSARRLLVRQQHQWRWRVHIQVVLRLLSCAGVVLLLEMVTHVFTRRVPSGMIADTSVLPNSPYANATGAVVQVSTLLRLLVNNDTHP